MTIKLNTKDNSVFVLPKTNTLTFALILNCGDFFWDETDPLLFYESISNEIGMAVPFGFQGVKDGDNVVEFSEDVAVNNWHSCVKIKDCSLIKTAEIIILDYDQAVNDENKPLTVKSPNSSASLLINGDSFSYEVPINLNNINPINHIFTLVNNANKLTLSYSDHSLSVEQAFCCITGFNRLCGGFDINYNLSRFLIAQSQYYDTAFTEISRGKKKTHWMWFIFPQLKGLGHSNRAKYYGLTYEEAKVYMCHSVLKDNLIRITSTLIALSNELSAEDIFGYTDSLKLKSSMTLFYSVTKINLFFEVLQKYYGGKQDTFTLELIVKSNQENQN